MKIKNFLYIFFFYSLLIPPINASIQDKLNSKNNLIENTSQKEQKIRNNSTNEKKVPLIISIDNLKELLIKNNKDLSKYKSQINQSESILKSKLAAWYPNVSLTSNEMPKYLTGNDIKNLENNTSSNQLKLGIDANIEWDIIKPDRKLEIKIARDKFKNNELLYSSSIEELYLESLKIYYLIQASFEEIQVANKSIEISNIAYKEAKEKLISGIGNKLEVLEAKIQLNRDEINLIKKLGDLEKNKNSLSKLLNINEEIIINKENVKSIKWIWPHNLENSILSAYKKRLDLKIKENNITINKNKSFSVLSGKKPNFKLYNKYSVSSANGEASVTDPNYGKNVKSNQNSVGIKFSWNLFDGGLIKQNFLSLKEKTNELEDDFEQSKSEIKKQLVDTFINYEIAKKNIVLSFDQMKAAKETLDITLKRMEAGLGTQREIVNVQADVAESESNFINSITEYNQNLAALERITVLKKSDICLEKNHEQNNQNREFYGFLIKNDLNNSCKEII